MASITGQSPSVKIIEHVYDPGQKFTPKSFICFEEGKSQFTPSQRAKKVWGQQRTFIYDKNPEELESEMYARECILKRVQPGQDGRTRVQDTTIWPHTALAQLTMKFTKLSNPSATKEYCGSGSIVGPHHVLTAAHNVYDVKRKEWAKEINIYPALDEKIIGNKTVPITPFGEIGVTRVYVFANWTDRTEHQYDIALLILNQSIGKYTGWAGMLSGDDTELVHQEVNIYGYPGDKGCSQQWGMKDKICKVLPEELEYEIDNFSGQSGSGVWIERMGTPVLVGVHALGGTINSGVRISKEKFDAFHKVISDTFKLIPAGPDVPPSLELIMPSTNILGAAEWNQYFGNVGAEPPLPAGIQNILDGPCPFIYEKVVPHGQQ